MAAAQASGEGFELCPFARSTTTLLGQRKSAIWGYPMRSNWPFLGRAQIPPISGIAAR